MCIKIESSWIINSKKSIRFISIFNILINRLLYTVKDLVNDAGNEIDK